MRTFHGILDINKDGVISFDDFKILVDRFVDLGHLSPKHQKEFYEVIQVNYRKSLYESIWLNRGFNGFTVYISEMWKI